MDATLYYIHDPMCSWCWGFRPTWLALQQALPAQVTVQAVLGGLAPDTEQPMPAALREQLQHTWRRIHDSLGTEFNFAFWEQCRPRRATWPACRAVIAAQQQGAGEAMVEAIQRAYYTRAMNPSDDATLATLAGELGLDVTAFAAALNAASTREALARQVAQGQALGAQGFPSLVLMVDGHRWPVAVDYRDAAAMAAQIDRLLAAS